MTHYFQKAIFGLFFLLCFYNANSKILKVETVANSGAGSLRDQIAAASPNDTILINIKGTLIIGGPHLIFDKPLTILGPSASHFSINVNSFQVIFDIPAGNIYMEGVRFTSPAFLCGDYVSVQQGTNLTLKNCVFENTQISGDGGAIKMMHTSVLNVENSSFFNCSASGNGGAIYVGATNFATLTNCTFFDNDAVNGGALYNDGNAKIVNCTFSTNTASGLGTAVRDNNNSAGTTTEIQNNIFTNLTSANILSSVQTWVNNGGNVFTTSAGALTFISIQPSDVTAVAMGSIFLRANAVTDGYGLKYFPIINSASPAVDNGISNANVKPTDCRRAPRALNGTGAATPLVDAGAVEFTPFTIISNSTASFNTIWGNMNSSVFAGPKYMDFDISGGGPVTFTPPGVLSNSTSGGIDWIIDGFTQDGSVVPGPGNTPNSYTPAIYQVSIFNNSTDVISLINPGLNSFISGLALSNPNTTGIRVDGGQIHIYGNKIIASGPLGSDAIYLENNNNALIGGNFHYCRNVLGNQTNAGINAFNNVTDISGNFIGCDATGTTDQSSDKGVFARGAICNIKGKIGLPSMNIISGNNTAQVDIQNGIFLIRGNIIGPDFTMNTLMGPCQYGIHAEFNTDGEIGGTSPGSMNVIGGNSTGIFLQGCNAANIFGNFIGISPDGTSGFPSIPNSTGISIYTNGDANHFIGNGSIQTRNYICNNSSIGIYMEDAAYHSIRGNFIGIKPDNSIAGNGTRGIHLVGASSEGNDFVGNVIGGHSVAGIDVNGANGSGNISGNKIGTDSTGMVSRSNGRGIQVAATAPNSQIIGNLISGNTNEGIHLDNSYHTIDGNLIGMNLDTTMALTNGGDGITLLNTNNCNIFNNYIGGNGANGILMDGSNANWIHGNHIGTNRIGMDFGNQLNGIVLFSVSANNMIGGPAAADQNSIMFNLGAGVDVEKENSVTGIRGNHFADNNIKAILLNTGTPPANPLVNDLNDTDASGAGGSNVGNNGQNTPDVTSAIFNAGTCTVTGTMNVDNTTANYLIQIYKVNPGNIDASGHGEGDTLIAEQTFNAAGLNTFNFTMNITGPVLGDILSLTTSKVVSVNYETSEFSDTILVRAPYTASIIDSSDVLCNGAADGRLEVLAAGSSNTPYTYQWHDGGGAIAGAVGSVYFGGPGTYFCVVTDAAAVIVNSDTATIIEPTPISISATTYNANCFGETSGAIDLNVIGGTGGYFFDWDNDGTGDFDDTEDLSNFPAGIYSVSVQDANGCIELGPSFTINQPAAISAFPTVTDESCAGLNDGSITVTAAGGTGVLNYQIDGMGYGLISTFSNLAPIGHSLDVQDANGCIFNLAATVNPGNTVTANFNVTSTNACQNTFDFDFTDASNFGASSMDSLIWTFSGASPSSAINVSTVTGVMFFSSGLNNVTLEAIDLNGCSDIITIPVNVNANPTVDAGIDNAICIGDPFFQDASITGTGPFNILWTPAGHYVADNIEDAEVSSGITTVPGTYTHTITVTDANGCMASDNMTLTVNSLPSVFAGIDDNVCQGSLYMLTGSGSATGYTWDNSVSNGTSFTFTNTTTYTVTGTDANGCQATDQVTLTADIPPTVFAGPDLDECRTTAFSTALAGAVTGAPTVLWSTSGSGSWTGTTTTNTTYFYSGADASSASITLTLTAASGNSCASVSDALTVTFHDAPSAFAGNDFSICTSSPINLNGAATGQLGVDWTGGAGVYSPDNLSLNTAYTPTPGEISIGSVNLTLTAYATNAACANSTDDILITLLTSPVANAGTDFTICNGQTDTLDGSSSTGTISIYQWDEVGVGTISNAITASVSPTTSTYYALTVDNGSCIDYDTVLVTVVTAPDATFTYPQSVYCQNAANPSPTAVTPGGSYSMPSSPGSINSTTGLISFATLGAGTYNVIYTLTNPCFAADTFQITVNPLPNVTVNGPFTLCSNTPAFDLNIFNPPTPGGTWSGTGVTNPNFDPSVAGVGTFGPSYSFTDVNGCTNTDSITIHIVAPPTPPTISGVNSNYCITDAPFTPTGTPAGGLWSVDGTLPFTTLTSIDPAALGNGFHTLTYQITDATTGCTGSSFPPTGFTISIMPSDPIAVSNTTQSICAGTSLILTVTNPNTGPTIQWYDDVALTNNVGASTNFVTPVLNSSVTYYAVAQNVGCKSGAIIFNITVNNALVSAGPDLTICPGTPAQLNVTAAAGTISWSPGVSLDDSTILNPLATPNVNTTYYVTVTSGPCSATDSITVFIDGSNPDCGIVPSYNAFSPDIDGVNDTWIVDAIFNHPDNTVTIFNRWGDKLVSFEDYDNVTVVWDGTYNGNLLPSGTYFYVIEYLDINQQVSGWLQLTR